MPDPYSEFKKALQGSDCRRCGLAEGRTNIVVDRGNPKAQILIIGEAPGRNEDLEGKAFVGRAGRLLDGLLREAGIDPETDVLIANVGKCRPPDNRPPTPQEAETCLPFLRKQIDLVKPRFIVLLGATAVKHLIPDKGVFKMGEEAGKLFEHAGYPGIRLMVLFHPAYLLRDPRKTPLFREHLGQFRAAYASR